MPAADMTGKVCLVTGATQGIGRAAALALAGMGATVAVVGRSPERTAAAVAAIRGQTGNSSVDALLADLSDQSQVRRLAHEIHARYPRLDVLINNAGGIFAQRRETVDGLELTFALNHLAYFLLTNLLLDRLIASAPARIVNVASGAHRSPRGLSFDDLQMRRGYFSFRAYARSKLANVLFTRELARRLAGTGVTANAVHPGLIHSGFGGNNGPIWDFMYLFINALARPPEAGADTVVYLAAAPEVEGVTGGYFHQRRPAAISPAARDAAAARRLWQASEQLTGLAAQPHFDRSLGA